MRGPLYKQIMLKLEQHIKDNFNPNEKLPSERQLVNDFQVSRSTIRLALDDLEQRGLIYRLHGKGTFVSPTILQEENLGDIYSLSNQLSVAGKNPSTKNFSLKLVTPQNSIAEQLNLSTGEKAYQLVRLRLAGKMPLVYSTSYLPQKFFPNLTLNDLKHESLYELMRRKYHQVTVLAFEDVQAVNLNAEQAKILQVKNATSSLKISRRTINDKNVPIEFTQAFARGDKFVYRSKQYNQFV